MLSVLKWVSNSHKKQPLELIQAVVWIHTKGLIHTLTLFACADINIFHLRISI